MFEFTFTSATHHLILSELTMSMAVNDGNSPCLIISLFLLFGVQLRRVALLGVVCSGLPPPRFRLVPSRHNTPLCRHQVALAVCHQVAQAPPIWGSGINPEGPGLTGGGPLLLAAGTLQMVSLPLFPTRSTSRVRPRPGEKKSFSMHRQDKKRRTMRISTFHNLRQILLLFVQSWRKQRKYLGKQAIFQNAAICDH